MLFKLTREKRPHGRFTLAHAEGRSLRLERRALPVPALSALPVPALSALPVPALSVLTF